MKRIQCFFTPVTPLLTDVLYIMNINISCDGKCKLISTPEFLCKFAIYLNITYNIELDTSIYSSCIECNDYPLLITSLTQDVIDAVNNIGIYEFKYVGDRLDALNHHIYQIQQEIEDEVNNIIDNHIHIISNVKYEIIIDREILDMTHAKSYRDLINKLLHVKMNYYVKNIDIDNYPTYPNKIVIHRMNNLMSLLNLPQDVIEHMHNNVDNQIQILVSYLYAINYKGKFNDVKHFDHNDLIRVFNMDDVCKKYIDNNEVFMDMLYIYLIHDKNTNAIK